MTDIQGPKIQILGNPCGQHGPYTFYKSFKYYFDEKYYKLSLGEFFYVKTSHDFPICIGELQLIWKDKSTACELASLRLYFLPQGTSEGRQNNHGEDEILALSEKVVLKLEDVMFWVVHKPVTWSEETAVFVEEPERVKGQTLPEDEIDESPMKESVAVHILSYPQYCRYKTLIKRLEGVQEKWLTKPQIEALGGLTVTSNMKVLFCRETFECPELEEHELRCDDLAPKLKGRKRKKKLMQDKDFTEGSSESSENADDLTSSEDSTKVLRRPKRLREELESNDPERGTFLATLYNFMKERSTPIDKIPYLGFKQIDLYLFYTLSSKIGGYEQITRKRLWKYLYDQLGGNPANTGAATCTRRQYERLLLPYELHQKGCVQIPPAVERMCLPGHSIMAKPKSVSSKMDDKEKLWEIRQKQRKAMHWNSLTHQRKRPHERTVDENEKKWNDIRRKKSWKNDIEIHSSGAITKTNKGNHFCIDDNDVQKTNIESVFEEKTPIYMPMNAVTSAHIPKFPMQQMQPIRTMFDDHNKVSEHMAKSTTSSRPSVIQHTRQTTLSQNAPRRHFHQTSGPVIINTHKAHENHKANFSPETSAHVTPQPAHGAKTIPQCPERPVDFSSKSFGSTEQRFSDRVSDSIVCSSESNKISTTSEAKDNRQLSHRQQAQSRGPNNTMSTAMTMAQAQSTDNLHVHPAFSSLMTSNSNFHPAAATAMFMPPHITPSQLFEVHPGMLQLQTLQAMQNLPAQIQQQILTGQPQMMAGMTVPPHFPMPDLNFRQFQATHHVHHN